MNHSIAREASILKQAWQLRRMRQIATGVLLAMTVVYALSVAFRSTSGVWSYVGAFAEAAMIGALADWFAVSALFRHPLGLPFPHTAIIPKNKNRIADNLGNFIEREFFSTARIQAVLVKTDPVRKFAGWLAQERNAARAAKETDRLLAFAVDSVDHAAVRDSLKKAARERFGTLDLSTLAGALLDGLTQHDRHQVLLDQLLHAASDYLNRSEVKKAMGDFLRENLPAYVFAYREEIAHYFTDTALDALTKKLDEVDNDHHHALRQWFSRKLHRFIEDLKSDQNLRDTIQSYQMQMVANDGLSAYIEGIWQDVHDWLKNDLARDDSRVQAHIASMMAALGRGLLHKPDVLSAINDELLRHVPGLLDDFRPWLGAFISGKMKEWSTDEIVEKLELNIGADLQYIRLNGTLVGGLIGLGIHVCTVMIASPAG